MASWHKSESWVAQPVDEEELKRLETKSCPSCGREYEGVFVRCPSDQMSLTPIPVPKGTIAKRFECGRKIGVGSLFDVYEGTDSKAELPVVVKALRHDFQCELHDLKRFEQEQMIAAALKHDHIATALAFGALPEQYTLRPFLVAERMTGVSLACGLKEWGKCDPDVAEILMRQICDAFQHAHSMGAVHSDFKPSNVFIQDGGKGPIAKIVDFAVSKRLFPGKESTRYGASASAQSSTSALYAAPELSKGASPNPQSDIYAIACVFYELLTGKPPFQGSSAFDLAFQHEKDEPPPVPDNVGNVNMREAIMKCLAKNPSERPEIGALKEASAAAAAK